MILIPLICIKPTKTLKLNKLYFGVPVRKEDKSSDYNGSYTTKWIESYDKKYTSFKIQDELNITRYISKRRFKIKL